MVRNAASSARACAAETSSGMCHRRTQAAVSPRRKITVDLQYRLTVGVGGRTLLFMAEMSEDVMIAEVERRLASKYAQFRTHEISSIVESAREKFVQSPIRDFVPLFVERNASARLDRLVSLAPAQ
jgi:hypothetical protein